MTRTSSRHAVCLLFLAQTAGILGCSKEKDKTVNCTDLTIGRCIEFTASESDADNIKGDCSSPQMVGEGSCPRNTLLGTCENITDDYGNKGTAVYDNSKITIEQAQSNCSGISGTWKGN